jgi:hypothetical protein
MNEPHFTFEAAGARALDTAQARGAACASSLVLAGGSASQAELSGGIGRGLLISRSREVARTGNYGYSAVVPSARIEGCGFSSASGS